MKKAILILFLLAGAYSVCNAQVFIGGGISYSTMSDEDKTTESVTNRENQSISISPMVGYAFNDKWSAGIYFKFGSSKSEYEYVSDYTTISKINSWGISPFARYTCYSKGKFSLNFEGRLNYTYNKNTTKDKYDTSGANYSEDSQNNFGLSIHPVFAYDLTRHISLEASVSLFRASYYKYDYDRNNQSSKNERDVSGFSVSLLGSGKSFGDVSLAMVYKF